MKKEWIAVIGIALIPMVMIGIYFLMVISGAIFLFNPNPPKPEITYGEFPCRITYELNGEKNVIEDVIICEFDGFDNLGSAGKYRKWKSRLKSGNEGLTLLNLRHLNEKNEFGHIILELFFSYGNGEYYMGDNERCSIPQISDYVEYKYKTKEGTIGGSAYQADEVYEKYKLRLISWECAPPIENSFK